MIPENPSNLTEYQHVAQAGNFKTQEKYQNPIEFESRGYLAEFLYSKYHTLSKTPPP